MEIEPETVGLPWKRRNETVWAKDRQKKDG